MTPLYICKGAPMQYIINIWLFIQNQLLGMKWLKYIVGELLTAAGVDISNRIGGSIQFFIYDLIKVFSLLICLFFIISYVQSYFPPERAQKIIANFHGFWAILIAAIFGIMTPFCSCSSILLFIGFTSAGLPFAATITFLIASPLRIWAQLYS